MMLSRYLADFSCEESYELLRRRSDKLKAIFLERGEEAWSHLQTNAIDEEYKAKFLDKVDNLVLRKHRGHELRVLGMRDDDERVVKVPYEDAYKEHERHAEGDAAHFYPSQLDASPNDEGKGHGEVRRPCGIVDDVNKPFHIFGLYSLSF